jgi:hypothetical protein
LEMAQSTQPSAPPGSVQLGLIPERSSVTIGDSLAFRLEFTNVSRDSVRVWMAPPYCEPSWNLLVRVQRPDGSVCEFWQPPYRQSIDFPADTDAVSLKPGAKAYLRLVFGSREKGATAGRFADWWGFTPAELERFRRASWGLGPSDSCKSCFGRAGTYELEASMSLTGIVLHRGQPGTRFSYRVPGPPVCRDSLRTAPVTITLEARQP